MRNLFKFKLTRSKTPNVGAVTEFEKKQISGAVFGPLPSGGPDFVELFINDTPVLKSPLRIDTAGNASFTIGMYDVWRFAKISDLISVRYADRSLPLPDGHLARHPERNGKENLDLLRERFDAGQAFDDRGRITKLSKDLDRTWQHGVMSLYGEVDEVIRKVTGRSSFIFSGTLLGYVRDNGFIPHDKDMDCAYVSAKTSIPEVMREFAALGDALIAAGYAVTPKASCISVRRKAGSKVMVDIAHLFLKSDGTVGFPFGRVGIEAVEPAVFLPVGVGKLSGYSVGVPAQPEDVVEHVYGTDWRVPDPAFKWRERRRSRDPQPLLDRSTRTRIAMDDLYSRPETIEPSAFARWLAGWELLPDLGVVMDLGCGNGRDLHTLVGAADKAIGIDRSPYAVKAATQLAAGDEAIDVRQGDVLHPGTIRDLSDAAAFGKPRLFYARFVLNGLTDDEQEHFLVQLRGALRPGDLVAFEHRTNEDEQLKKARFRSFRRFIDTDGFAGRLEELDLEIVHRQEGTGLAPFEREDPHVVRLVAKLP